MTRMTDHLVRYFVGVCAPSVGLVFLAACTTDYQKGLGDPNFGDPNALVGKRPPGPTSDNTTVDGGIGTASPDSPLCLKSGGALVDAGPCSISFKADILGDFRAATCQTVGSCHGGVSPTYPPRVDPDDGPKMWETFAAFKLTNGQPYINPCSTNPTDSAMLCNLNSKASCGEVMPLGNTYPAESLAKIETWLKCGAPNN